jgi:molybdate transport system regulatory protein
MYIRKSIRSCRGRTYTNYVLVESAHTAKGPRQKTICSDALLAAAQRPPANSGCGRARDRKAGTDALRIDLSAGRAVGPVKIRLEQIHKRGSIIQAGRDLGLSYRRAWLLIDDLNNSFGYPVIEAETGGVGGGGTRLTPFGRKLMQVYQAIEAEALAATWGAISKLS